MKSIIFSAIVIFAVVASCLAEEQSIEKLETVKDASCKCLARVSSRVVNGEETNELRYPWQATLYSQAHDAKFAIGAATILNSDGWLLTAASVLPDPDNKTTVDQLRVKLPGIKKLYRVEKVIMDRLYERSLFAAKFDIGLIKLNQKLNFNVLRNIQPACLDMNVTEVYENELSFAGYGSQKAVTVDKVNGSVFDFVPSNTLREGFVKDLTTEAEECKAELENFEFICAKNEERKAATCLGDGGVPIHHLNGKYTYVVGLAGMPVLGKSNDTHVTLCEDVNKFARLSFYSSWLKFKLPKGSTVCTAPAEKVKMLGE